MTTHETNLNALINVSQATIRKQAAEIRTLNEYVRSLEKSQEFWRSRAEMLAGEGEDNE